MDLKQIRQLQWLIVIVMGAVVALMLITDGWRSKDWLSMALLAVAVWAGLDAQILGQDGVNPRTSRLVLSAIATAGSLASEFFM